jgi:uracil phosphoribosyltransferase
MRAGNGMIDGVLTLVPNATVCHLGLYREKSTLLPGIPISFGKKCFS